MRALLPEIGSGGPFDPLAAIAEIGHLERETLPRRLRQFMAASLQINHLKFN